MINPKIPRLYAKHLVSFITPYLVPNSPSFFNPSAYEWMINNVVSYLMDVARIHGSVTNDETFKSFLSSLNGGYVSNAAYAAVAGLSVSIGSGANLNYQSYAFTVGQNCYQFMNNTDLSSGQTGSAGGITHIELQNVLVQFAEDFLTDRIGPKVLVNGVLKAANLAERQAYWTPETDLESWVA